MGTWMDCAREHENTCRAAMHWGLVILPLVAALWLVFSMDTGGLSIHRFFVAWRGEHAALTWFMKLVTDWSNPVFYVLFAVLCWRGIREERPELTRLAVAYVVVQVLVSFLLVRILKVAIGSPRPDEGGFNVFFSFSGVHNSIPSGHTCEFAAAALSVAMWRGSWRLSVLLGLALALVGFSRIYLSMHHPGDVGLGLMLGAVAGPAIHVFRQEQWGSFGWWERVKEWVRGLAIPG